MERKFWVLIDLSGMERLEGVLAEIVAAERRGDYLVPANPSTLKTKFVFYVYCSNKRTYKTTGIQSLTVKADSIVSWESKENS